MKATYNELQEEVMDAFGDCGITRILVTAICGEDPERVKLLSQALLMVALNSYVRGVNVAEKKDEKKEMIDQIMKSLFER